MPRSKSGDKRKAILEAATQLFAERSPAGTPTAEISRRAGVAEGTLFTYFPSKDELANALYREIRTELAEAMMADFPRRKKIRRRLRHLWSGYVSWGLRHGEQRKVLRYLEEGSLLTRESRLTGGEPWAEVENIAREAVERHMAREGLAGEFICRAFDALAAATVEFAARSPEAVETTAKAGFKMFWTGIKGK